MTLLGWIRGRSGRRDNDHGRKLDAWRNKWQEATAAPDAVTVVALTTELENLGLAEEEIEIEREMIEGLDQLVKLHATLAAEGLPVVQTGHRVVGTDICHFSAPTSMPDDPAQPSGRLIFTGVRAIFAGGARALTVPWHSVSNVVQQGRDVVLVRHDRETLHRFRCNVFADALCAALLARTLARRPQTKSQEVRKSREAL
jgi:hypothetical protein